MDTWKVAKWMSESVKTVFSAVTTGPSDAVKFGEKSESDKPYEDCNTKHEVQGFRTIADKAGKKSHALTDQIIVDFREICFTKLVKLFFTTFHYMKYSTSFILNLL